MTRDTRRGSSHLNHQRFGGGAAARDAFRDVVALGSPLVVQRCSGDGRGPGELDDPVAVEVVLAAQVLDGWTCTEVSQRRRTEADPPQNPPR